MVFSSVPLYPDPPNWNQPGSSSIVINEVHDVHHLPQPPRTTPSSCAPHQAAEASDRGAASDQRSIAERARLAKIPQTETALKCPRCDSTNTKFCYFNNYSLTQPRHFCKTCRRYWTRGGALRSVPVGGGCRRNKRGNPKPASSNKPSCATPSAPSSSVAFHPAPPPFLATWQQPDYGLYTPPQSMGLDQWRIQQIPFLGPFASDTPSPLYPFEGELISAGHGKIMSTVKMEESSQAAANMPRQFFSVGRNDGQIWQGGGGDGAAASDGHGGRWISGDHLSGGFSSSTGNFL